MDKESIIELQKIDCNCNDCKFMQRDFETYKKWENWHRGLDLKEYEKKSQMEIQQGLRVKPFQFDKSKLIQYGICKKFDKKVSFIPNICQLETQKCFEHRRL